tara:strand:- start:58243 stop:61041 length:2799 start_codon:yes stop_codon:yes gene_type:complete
MEVNVEYINSFIKWIKRNSRLILIWLSLIFIFILLEDRISNLISKYSLVEDKEVNGRYFGTLFYIVKRVVVFSFVWLFITNYRISKHINFWLLFSCVGYYILKTNSDDKLIFLQYGETSDTLINYADIFLLIGFFTIVLFIRNLFDDFEFYDSIRKYLKKNLYLKDGEVFSEYKEDMPIDGSLSIDNDKVVNAIIPHIDNLKPSNAFVIGVNAEWGSGKTTFLKRLDYQIKYNVKSENPSPITFWFNAWQHQDEKSIINNFFNQLKKQLSNYSGDAKTSINSYLSQLFAVIDGKYSKGVRFITNDVLNNDVTIKDYYDNIDNLISRINKKIIVFVDDLDRLNKNEIIEVVRILRNVANFKNTIFICGFDKSYVLKTGEFETNFLDKIFNLEVNLPKLHQNGLLIFFKELLESSVFVKDKKLIYEKFDSLFDTDTDNFSIFDVSIEDILTDSSNQPSEPPKFFAIPLSPSLFFETRRDVKRFYNSLITNISILGNINDIELDNYLLFKVVIFRYSWLLNYFDNRRLGLWLGNSSVLKLKSDKLDFLDNRKDLELIDKLTIFTVLEKLFPDSSINSIEEGSRKINQRRYLPIYLNNNVFNQSFSYSELLKAHKNLEIGNLIEQKILNKENENYLLNDIKSFLLEQDNLKSIEELEQTVNVIKTYLKDRMSDFELIKLIHKGESIEGFKEFADKKIFTNIVDVFGEFLRLLNLNYSRNINDISGNNSDIDEYFSRIKTKELSIINKSYVEQKIIDLLEEYLKEKRSIQEVSRIMFDCSENHIEFFDFRLYLEKAVEFYKKYLKENFKTIFIDNAPKEFLNFFNRDFVASLFIDKSEKEEMIEKAKKLLTERRQWSQDDLDKEKFWVNGWNNFVAFLEEEYQNVGLSDEEITKAKEFIAFIRVYIKKGFIIPKKSEVLVDDIIKKMIDKDKREEGE